MVTPILSGSLLCAQAAPPASGAAKPAAAAAWRKRRRSSPCTRLNSWPVALALMDAASRRHPRFQSHDRLVWPLIAPRPVSSRLRLLCECTIPAANSFDFARRMIDRCLRRLGEGKGREYPASEGGLGAEPARDQGDAHAARAERRSCRRRLTTLPPIPPLFFSSLMQRISKVRTSSSSQQASLFSRSRCRR